MANITLGQLRDLWKNVSDWVTGVATHEPKVQLSGRHAAIVESLNYTTPLGASEEFVQSPAIDVLTTDVAGGRPVAIGGYIIADAPGHLEIRISDSSVTTPWISEGKLQDAIYHSGNNAPVILPWQPINGRKVWFVYANMSAPQTNFRLVQFLANEPLLESLYFQPLPVDSGSITIPAGGTFLSRVFALPRVGRVAIMIRTGRSTDQHGVHVVWSPAFADNLIGSGEWAHLIELPKTQPGTSSDIYEYNGPTFAQYMQVRIQNTSATERTFKVWANGYPR